MGFTLAAQHGCFVDNVGMGLGLYHDLSPTLFTGASLKMDL